MAVRRKWSMWQKLLAALGGIFALFVVAFIWGSSAARSNLEAELKKMQALGYAVDLTEFKERLPPDDETNAATIYYRAMEVYGGMGKPTQTTKDWKGRRDPHKRASFIMITEPVYKLVVEASQKPNCVFTRNWDDGVTMAFPEYEDMKQFAAILRDRAVHNALLGKWQSSLDDLSIAIKLGGHVRQDPTLVATLVGIATEYGVLQSFVEVCAASYTDPKFRDAAQKWLAALPAPPDRRRAFDYEIAGIGRFIDQLSDRETMGEALGKDHPKLSGALVRFLMSTEFGRNSIKSTFLREMHRALEAPYESPHADIQRWVEFDSRMQGQRTVSGKVASIFAPLAGLQAKALARVVDLRRMSAVSMWVMEKHAVSGALPLRLPDEERFRDLYTGEPYVLTKTESGFRLLSFGPNRIDDGGSASGHEVKDDIKLDVDLNPPNPWRRR